MTDLELATNGERIVWRGKPKFKCFLCEAVFNPMFFVSLFWLCMVFAFLKFGFDVKTELANGDNMFMVIFFLFYMIPLWLYLGGVIVSILKYKNKEYIITERGVYISSGIATINVQMKPFTELSHINIHKGIIDQILGVGDVVMTCEHTGPAYDNQPFNICDIEEYQQVFKIIKEMQTDIYSDTMYPNALRPDNNPGYKTTYNKF